MCQTFILGPRREAQQLVGLIWFVHRIGSGNEHYCRVGGSVAFGSNNELGERRELSSYPGSVTGLLDDMGQIALFLCLSNVGYGN